MEWLELTVTLRTKFTATIPTGEGERKGGREKEHPKRNPSCPNTLYPDSSALVTHKWAGYMHVTAAETLHVDSGYYFL